MRTFDSGATRDSDAGKPDYEGFLSPLVIEAFGRYMLKHQTQADGSRRDSDNWQKGIPQPAYIKSGWRHFFDWWGFHRGMKLNGATTLEDAICALIFNAQGYLHEYLKSRQSADGRQQTDEAERCARRGASYCSCCKFPPEKFEPEDLTGLLQKSIEQARKNLRQSTDEIKIEIDLCSCGHGRFYHPYSESCEICACAQFSKPATNH